MLNINSNDDFLRYCSYFPIDGDTTIDEIENAERIWINIPNLDTRFRFDAALQEFFRNSGIAVDWNLLELFIKDSNVHNPPEPIQLIENVQYVHNDYWHCWWMRFSEESALFVLEWEQNAYGFWTHPGVQIYRCLGQNLQVSIIPSNA